MKKLITLGLCCVGVFCMMGSGCRDKGNKSDAEFSLVTEQARIEAIAQVGYPAIVNFQEMRWAKEIFELRDQADLICYAYIVSLEGKLIFIGKCLGYGLPYSVQYTSPSKMVYDYGANESYKGPMPQADPNGLFMPTGLSATWLMMIDPKTAEAKPVYCEPEIFVSPFPLHKEA